jgi:hypothetical protein
MWIGWGLAPESRHFVAKVASEIGDVEDMRTKEYSGTSEAYT